MNAILAKQIIDSFSIFSSLAASFIFFYILVKYYKGMKTPPFWIYAFGAFLVLTFVSILAIAAKTDELILRIISLVGHLLFLIGVIELLKSYKSKIKFDKK